MLKQKSGDILLINYKRNDIEQNLKIMMVEKVSIKDSSICLCDITTQEQIILVENDVISYVQVA